MEVERLGEFVYIPHCRYFLCQCIIFSQRSGETPALAATSIIRIS